MPTAHEVRIKILGMLGLDTSQAEQGMQTVRREAERTAEDLQRTFQRKAPRVTGREAMRMQSPDMLSQIMGQTGVSPAMQGPLRELITERIGPQASFRQQHAEFMRLEREQAQQLRVMQGEYRKLHEARDYHSKQRKGQLREEIDQQRELVQSLHNVRRVGESIERQHEQSSQGRMRSIMGWLGAGASRGGRYPGMSRMTFGQAVRGGGLYGGMGALGRMAMSNPLIAVPTLLAGGSAAAFALAQAGSRRSDEIEMIYQDLARRTGQAGEAFDLGEGPHAQTYRNLRRLIEPRLPGEPRESFRRLAFTGSEIGRTLQAYGIRLPVHREAMRMLAPVESQLEFARAFGFGQQPEMIGGIARRMTQLGIEPNQQQGFWRQMGEVMRQAQEQGVDSSDTFKAMIRLLEVTAHNTGVIDQRIVSGLGSMLTAFGHGGRFFQGERGAENMMRMMGGFTDPRSLSGQVIMINALKSAFGGEVPSAQRLGLVGGEARAYEAMHPIQRARAVLKNTMRFMQAGSPVKSEMMQTFVTAGGGLPDWLQSMWVEQMTGFDPAQLLAMLTSFEKNIDKMPPVIRENYDRLRRSGPFGQFALIALGRQHQAEAIGAARNRPIIREGDALTQAIFEERARAGGTRFLEIASGEVARDTRKLRATGVEEAATQLANVLSGTHAFLSDPVTAIRQGVEQGIKAALGNVLSLSQSAEGHRFHSPEIEHYLQSQPSHQRAKERQRERLETMEDMVDEMKQAVQEGLEHVLKAIPFGGHMNEPDPEGRPQHPRRQETLD